jgi:hypothetical protein
MIRRAPHSVSEARGNSSTCEMTQVIKSQKVLFQRSRCFALTLIVLSASFLSGCWVQSVYPFYEDSDVIVDANLNGTWVGDGELKGCSLAISVDAATQTYTLAVSKSAEADPSLQCDSMTSQGKLLQVGTQRFLDIAPDQERGWPATLDTLLKVDADKQKLSLTPLDPDWIENAMNEKAVKLQGRVQEFGVLPRFVAVTLVSPTSDLRDFLRQGDTKAAFSESSKMSFRRNGVSK